jgi:hypothetical protein
VARRADGGAPYVVARRRGMESWSPVRQPTLHAHRRPAVSRQRRWRRRRRPRRRWRVRARRNGAGPGAAEAKDLHAHPPAASVCVVGAAGDVAARGDGGTADLPGEGRLRAAVAVVAILHASEGVAVLVAEAGAILARGCAVELLANVVAQAPTAFSATRGAAALEAVGARVLQEASLRGVHGAAPGRGARSGGGGGSGQQQREEGRHRIVFELAVEVSRKRAMRFLGVLIENLHTKCYTTIYAKL